MPDFSSLGYQEGLQNGSLETKTYKVDVLTLQVMQNHVRTHFMLINVARRSALTAISAFLDAFQKIADAATNARGKFIFSI